MPLNKEILNRISNKKYFVETGSWLGDGIQAALNSGFEQIISIEIAENYFNICRERFKNNKNVNLVIGDSCDNLSDVIKNIDDQITFWLDGHFSGGDTGFGKYEYPLIQELDQIKNHHIKNHNILIDDMRLFSDKNQTTFDVNILIDKLLSINKDYKISFVDGYTKNDILVAII